MEIGGRQMNRIVAIARWIENGGRQVNRVLVGIGNAAVKRVDGKNIFSKKY